jgi:hypothetical protein
VLWRRLVMHHAAAERSLYQNSCHSEHGIVPPKTEKPEKVKPECWTSVVKKN